MDVLVIITTIISLAAVSLAVVTARVPRPIRPGKELLRIAIAGLGIVIVAAITGVATAPALAVGAGVLGLGLGLVQGRGTEVWEQDGALWFRRGVLGAVLFGAGMIGMQVAGIGSRTGLFQFGQAVAIFSVCVLIGSLMGRASGDEIGPAVPGAVGLFILVAAVVASGIVGAAPALAQGGGAWVLVEEGIDGPGSGTWLDSTATASGGSATHGSCQGGDNGTYTTTWTWQAPPPRIAPGETVTIQADVTGFEGGFERAGCLFSVQLLTKNEGGISVSSVGGDPVRGIKGECDGPVCEIYEESLGFHRIELSARAGSAGRSASFTWLLQQAGPQTAYTWVYEWVPQPVDDAGTTGGDDTASAGGDNTASAGGDNTASAGGDNTASSGGDDTGSAGRDDDVGAMPPPEPTSAADITEGEAVASAAATALILLVLAGFDLREALMIIGSPTGLRDALRILNQHGGMNTSPGGAPPPGAPVGSAPIGGVGGSPAGATPPSGGQPGSAPTGQTGGAAGGTPPSGATAPTTPPRGNPVGAGGVPSDQLGPLFGGSQPTPSGSGGAPTSGGPGGAGNTAPSGPSGATVPTTGVPTNDLGGLYGGPAGTPAGSTSPSTGGAPTTQPGGAGPTAGTPAGPGGSVGPSGPAETAVPSTGIPADDLGGLYGDPAGGSGSSGVPGGSGSGGAGAAGGAGAGGSGGAGAAGGAGAGGSGSGGASAAGGAGGGGGAGGAGAGSPVGGGAAAGGAPGQGANQTFQRAPWTTELVHENEHGGETIARTNTDGTQTDVYDADGNLISSEWDPAVASGSSEGGNDWWPGVHGQDTDGSGTIDRDEWWRRERDAAGNPDPNSRVPLFPGQSSPTPVAGAAAGANAGAGGGANAGAGAGAAANGGAGAAANAGAGTVQGASDTTAADANASSSGAQSSGALDTDAAMRGASAGAAERQVSASSDQGDAANADTANATAGSTDTAVDAAPTEVELPDPDADLHRELQGGRIVGGARYETLTNDDGDVFIYRNGSDGVYVGPDGKVPLGELGLAGELDAREPDFFHKLGDAEAASKDATMAGQHPDVAAERERFRLEQRAAFPASSGPRPTEVTIGGQVYQIYSNDQGASRLSDTIEYPTPDGGSRVVSVRDAIELIGRERYPWP